MRNNNSEQLKGEDIRSKRKDKQKGRRLQERYLFRAGPEIQEIKEPEIKQDNNKSQEKQKRGYGILISNAYKAEGILNYINELTEEDIKTQELKNKAAEAQDIVNQIKESHKEDEQKELLRRLNEVYDTILNGLSKTIENKKFTDKDAENIVKIVGGENVFEREEVEDLIDEVINDYKEGKLENQEIFNITGELRKKMIEQGYNESQRDEAVEQLARKLNWEIGEDGKIIKAAEAAETGSEKKISHQEAQLRRAEMADNEINKYFIQGTMEPKKSLKEMENERAGRAREEINNTLSDTEMYEREELIEELKERYLALWGERSAILGESGTDRTERFRDVEKKIGEIEKEFARLGMKIDLFKWIGEKEETVKGSKALAEPVSTVGEDEKEIIREEVETEEEKKNAEIEKAILEELEKMPQKEKIKLSKGLANLGLYVEYGKNSFFSNVLNRLTKPIAKKDKHIAEQGTLARFLISMAENYGKDAERAENKLMQKGRKGLVNYRYIASNISMYGRNLADVVGWTAASPFRYIMAGTMFFARGAQAAKEARLKNKEVMEKTRIDDIDKAEEEAWEIYKSARDRGKDQVTGEYLEKAYQKNLPKDLLNRLKNRVNAGQTYNIIGNIVAKDIGRSVKKIEMKLDNIEKNKKLSKEERTIKKEKILEKYNKFLKDLDGMVSKYGAIDGLALGAKYAETGAKTVIAGLTVESLYLLTQNLPKLYNDLHNLYDSISAEDGTVGKGIETAAVKHPIMPGQRPAGHAERPAVLSEIEKIKENIAQEAALRKGKFDLAAIHDKEGIEHAIRRQLEAEPENYGYKGNMNDKAAIHKWSGGEADRAAIKAGYVNPETGEEIRVGAKGIDKAAYVLEKDAQGKTQIHEYFKGEDGSFKSQEVHGLAENFKGAKFEGADKEFYEYEHKGGAEGKILHLMNHKNNLDQAAESIKMVEGANVSYDDAYEYFYQFKNVSGNPGRMEGIVEILKHHDYKSGLSKIFGVAVTEKNFEVKGGVYRIKDFKPGFDYVVKIDGGEMKFGVDGPLGQWNWGARGRTWRAYIDADLTNENLEKSKSEVENMLKIFEKRR